MPVVGDVVGIAIVRAERDAARPVLGDQRQQRMEVPRHRRLADQEPHPRPQPLPAFLHGERLVVGADAGRGVRLERRAEHAGRVAVDVLGAFELELRELGGVGRDHAREIHHLGEPEHAPPAHQRLEVAEREWPPGRLEDRGRYARRRHEEHLELELGRGVVEPVHAVRAEDVRDLVRVGDDGGRSEREHEAGKLVDEELHRLEVHVRIDEARDDEATGRVDRLGAFVGPDPGDRPVDDRDVGVEPLPGEHREDTAPTDDQVGRLVSARDGEAALQGLHRADDNGSLRTGGLGYNAGMAGAACTHLDTAQVTELPDPVTGSLSGASAVTRNVSTSASADQLHESPVRDRLAA